MNHCLNCGQTICRNLPLLEIFSFKPEHLENICEFCKKQLVELKNYPYCPSCFKRGSSDLCLDCKIWRNKYKIFNQHFAIYGYNQFIHDYFKKYKRYGDILLAKLFQKEIFEWADKNTFDLVTFVPSSHSHFQARGFDPVLELYKDVFDLQSIFIKEDADLPQAQKNKIERMNTPQTFKICSDFPKKSLDIKILIVDDIYTTGRTVLHARQLLNDLGFQNIYTFSLTR